MHTSKRWQAPKWIKMIEKGEIYLTNLNKGLKNSLARTRPVLIFQNDFLNRALEDQYYKDVTVIPLSTKLLGGNYRYVIDAREKLEKKSEIICNAVTTIDYGILDVSHGHLTKLTPKEMTHVEHMLYDFFGCTFMGR